MVDDRELTLESAVRVNAMSIVHVSKTFPGLRALDDVSIEVERGTIHCLLGGNGSGKSSLIKILAGVYQGDPGGTVTVGEKTELVEHSTPQWARSAGLHFVHQDLAVFGSMSVAENLAIGRGFPVSHVLKAIRWRALKRHARTALERFQVRVDPDRLMAELRPAERTMVAITRALQDQSLENEGILVLDEPTVALPATEVQILFDALRRYAQAGQTIVLVTHRLEEVIRIADRVTVLRDGQVAATLDAGQFDYDRLVEVIVGHVLDHEPVNEAALQHQDLVLEVSDLVGGPLHGVTFGLRYGEVLGVAGLLGSGRTSLLTTLFGATPAQYGTVKLAGEPVTFSNVDQAMDAGVAFVPQDRSESAFLDLDLRENLSAADLRKYWHRFVLHRKTEREDARRSITEFSIKAISERQPFAALSGGNQQKAVVARWLRRKPRLLLLDEPTQGVDIEARGAIYRLVRTAVASGSSVIVALSDFEELTQVADRVLVLAHGRVAGELLSPNINASRITELVLSASATESSDGQNAHEIEGSHR